MCLSVGWRLCVSVRVFAEHVVGNPRATGFDLGICFALQVPIMRHSLFGAFCASLMLGLLWAIVGVYKAFV